ncbi:DapH/DapD/GlmU-related protein [Aeromicrobium sp.]|uniref:PglD-related sugar-binding protein n=1 Tax=Aeromicrobium sp. TaxID=1871063 RepID=UPI0019CD7ABB|nr:DapH/DapD/GlmU-related protein [Aeromicrobium sp.]MBC7630143.1 transferase [Aeromicrobium sp.]
MPVTVSPSLRRWVVFGASGHAGAVIDVIEQRHDEVIALVGVPDRDWPYPVVDSDTEGIALAVAEDAAICLAIGNNPARLALLVHADLAARAHPLQSPHAHVSTTAALGRGVVVMSGAHLGPYSTVADGAIVNTHAVVEHDSRVGAGAHVAPGALLLGASSVGRLSLIGAGSVVLPGVIVGDDVTVGAGSVVIDNAPGPTTVAGNPARPLHGHAEETR